MRVRPPSSDSGVARSAECGVRSVYCPALESGMSVLLAFGVFPYLVRFI